MKYLRDLSLLVLILSVAFGGGYYFGRHPESLRDLMNSKSLVIATTEKDLFTKEVQHFIEDRWGHTILVNLISEAEVSDKLKDYDLIIAPKSILKPLNAELKDQPSAVPRDWILPDLFINEGKTFPLIWKLLPLDNKRWRLVELVMAWTPKSEPDVEPMRWMLSRQVQALMTVNPEFMPARRDLLEESKQDQMLRSIPLSDLSYE